MRVGSILAFVTIIFGSSRAQQYMFDFKYDGYGVDNIDTFNNTFKRRYIDSVAVVTFELTEVEQKKIAEYADKFGLHKINMPVKIKNCRKTSLPALTYQVEYLNKKGELIYLIWGNNDCNDKTIKKLQMFVDTVHQLILGKDEFKKLKESDVGFL